MSFFINRQTVEWLSPPAQQLFSNNPTSSLLEVLFSGKHCDYIRQLLSGSLSIDLHPIRHLSRYLLENHGMQKESTGTPPLMRLLIMLGAKLLGEIEKVERSKDEEKVIENHQYSVALTAEKLLFLQLFHSTVVNVNSATIRHLHECPCNSDSETLTEKMLHKGNKLATLIGDLLMTRIYSQLGSIGNCQVTEVMSKAFADYGEHLMLAEENARRIHRISELEIDNIALSGFSQLMGKSFLSVAIISGQRKDSQDLAEELGILIGQIIQEYVVCEIMGRKSHLGNDNDKETSLEIQQLRRKTIKLISEIQGSSQIAKSLITLIEDL